MSVAIVTLVADRSETHHLVIVGPESEKSIRPTMITVRDFLEESLSQFFDSSMTLGVTRDKGVGSIGGEERREFIFIWFE